MLEGQKVIVFGGSSGAGLASARLLASKGAEVIVTGRDPERMESARKAGLGTTTVDGRDVEAVEAFFREIGPFDHLVLTAGQTSRGGDFVAITTDAFRETFDGKFWVQIHAARAGARSIRRGGSITFFSGGANRRALRGMVNVAAVNAAIDGVVPTLAIELAPTRVNAISPGTMRTGYWRGVPEAQLEQVFDRTAKALPAGRVGTPEDIANAVLFVVTTGFVTGSIVTVDGGVAHSSL